MPPAQHEGAGRTVLMVDDDPDVRTSVARGLRHSGFDVRVAATGKEALRLLSTESHDALVLDVQMPELDGVAVVTALRALGNDIPICVLSARDTVNDRIAGGSRCRRLSDQTLRSRELVARLHALLRRSAHSDEQSDTMTVGPVTIDTARRLVFVDGERVDLTKREFDLLAVLVENAGVVLSRQRLLEMVWGYDFDVETNVADVFISYLRRKLERDGLPRVIHTVRGSGTCCERSREASSRAEQCGTEASSRAERCGTEASSIPAVGIAAHPGCRRFGSRGSRRGRRFPRPDLRRARQQRCRTTGSAAGLDRRRQHVSRTAAGSAAGADHRPVAIHRQVVYQRGFQLPALPPGTETVEVNGVEYRVRTIPVEQDGGVLMSIGIRADSILLSPRRIPLYTAVGVITVLGAAGLGWLLAGPAIRPLRKLTEHTKRLGKGNEQMPEVRGVREAEDLSEAMSGMLRRLAAAQQATTTRFRQRRISPPTPPTSCARL